MKTLKKIQKTLKALQVFLNSIYKNYKNMTKKISTIWACLILFALLSVQSCGSTKVSVEKPAQGTQTTITVTTNNPITTEVNPTTELNKK